MTSGKFVLCFGSQFWVGFRVWTEVRGGIEVGLGTCEVGCRVISANHTNHRHWTLFCKRTANAILLRNLLVCNQVPWGTGGILFLFPVNGLTNTTQVYVSAYGCVTVITKFKTPANCIMCTHYTSLENICIESLK